MTGEHPDPSRPAVLRLRDIAPRDRPSVGNKAWYLARLLQEGFDVPAALVIPRDSLQAIADGAPGGALSGGEGAFWERLRAALGDGPRLEGGVAVRSSSATEDTEHSSMAGQFLTILRVRTWQELQDAVRQCRRTLRGGLAQGDRPEVAVLIQEMVEADLAGVAFSRDPVLGEGVAIEFSRGTAEHLVSAEIVPGRVAFLGGELRPVPGGPEPTEGEARILRQVAAAVLRIETSFGFPVDVEWAAAGGRVRILQARPITTGTAAAPRRIPGAPPGAWTRKIAEDLWADPLTTFEEGLLLDLAPAFDLRRWARWAGLSIPDDIKSLGAIGSHLYVSCGVLETALRSIPGFLRIGPVLSLFPPGMDPRAVPGPGILAMVRAVLGALALGLLHLEANPLTSFWFNRRRARRFAAAARRLGAVDLGALSARDLGGHLEACVALLGGLLVSNQFPYLYAVLFSWLSVHLGERSGLPREAWLSRLGGTGDNATRRMALLLAEVGRGLASGDVGIDGRTFEEVVADLERRGQGSAARAARDLRAEFGVRAGQRSLIERRWEEDPLEILRRARGSGAPAAPGKGAPAASGGPRPGIILRAFLWAANRYLDLREDLRFTIDAALLSIRKALLEAGRRSGLSERIFFLREPEVMALLGFSCDGSCDGSGSLDAAEAERRSGGRLEAFRQAPQPAMFVLDGVPVVAVPPGAKALRGVGASPGTARGPVRILRRPEDADALGRGDIAVAALMGPAWAPVLRVAGAVVTEKGGLLDHFAILAREAGVPAVTGAEGAVEALAGVAEASVDGTAGIVTW